jgi:hypothetical protein
VLCHGGAGHAGIAVLAVVPEQHLGIGLFTNVGAVSIDPGNIDRLAMNVLALLLD